MINEVTTKNGFYISYNPAPFIGYEGEETALVINDKYFILLGDFRKQYKKIKTLKGAISFFKRNKSKIGSWSNSLKELPKLK